MKPKLFKIGDVIPPNHREYPNVKDQCVARIDWNYNGDYYAIYLNKSASVLASASGRSLKSICANNEQLVDATKVVADIKEWSLNLKLLDMDRAYDGHGAWGGYTKTEKAEYLRRKRAGTLPPRRW